MNLSRHLKIRLFLAVCALAAVTRIPGFDRVVERFYASERMDSLESCALAAPEFDYYQAPEEGVLSDAQVSFKAFVLSDAPNSVTEALGPECASALRGFYQAGRRFDKVDDLDGLIQTIERFPTGSRIFYHYTDAEAMCGIAEKNTVGDIFQFIRTKNGTKLWDQTFFIAEDAESSAKYGKFQIRVHVRPGTKIINLAGAGGTRAVEKAMRRIRKKYGELDACEDRLHAGSWGGIYNKLLYPLLEDKGVGMIHYTDEKPWDQVLNPSAIERLKFGGERGRR